MFRTTCGCTGQRGEARCCVIMAHQAPEKCLELKSGWYQGFVPEQLEDEVTIDSITEEDQEKLFWEDYQELGLEHAVITMCVRHQGEMR